MMFGEEISESPRVPSPWTRSRIKKSPKPKPVKSGRGGDGGGSHQKAKQMGKPRVNTIAFDADESTPPTEDDDSFFALDVDLDLDKLDVSDAAIPTIRTTAPSLVTISTTEESVNPTTSTATTTTTTSVTSATASSVTSTLEVAASHRRLAPEPDSLGNLEYKLRVLPPTRHRYDRLLTQLKWRLLQGGGYCTYEIGVLDDGRCVGICASEMRASLRVLARLASELDASVRVRRVFRLSSSSGDCEERSEKPKTSLQSLNNEEANALLLQTPHFDVAACACTTKEEVQCWPFNGTQGEGGESQKWQDRSSSYTIDIAEGVDGSLPTTCFLESDSDSTPDEDNEDGEDEGATATPADDEGMQFTFSLSLDEMTTRRGLRFQENIPRRNCRYYAKGASMQRQKEAVARQLAAAAAAAAAAAGGVVADPSSGDLLQIAANDADLLQSGDDSLSSQGSTPARRGSSSDRDSRRLNSPSDMPVQPCERIIVEAVIHKPIDAEQGSDYIDYASL